MGIGAALALNGDLIREIRDKREAALRALAQDRLRPCVELVLSESEMKERLPHVFTDKMKATTKSPDKVFLLEREGVINPAYNGSNYRDFAIRYLPTHQVPAMQTKTEKHPIIRLVLLHGLGLSISNMGSVLPLARKLRKIANGGEGDPFATWFAHTYPHLQIPMEIVAFDLPSAGWAPSLDNFRDGIEVANYLAINFRDLNEMEKLPTLPVCRSASCALGAIGGTDTEGLVLTAGTFPTRRIIDLNLIDIATQAKTGKTVPNQPVIDKVVAMFTDPKFYQAFKTALKKPVAIRTLIGSDDGETPLEAQKEWARAIAPRFGLLSHLIYPGYRSQFIIKRAEHQVFSRLNSLPADQFNESDPDVIALRLLLEFALQRSTHFWNKVAFE